MISNTSYVPYTIAEELPMNYTQISDPVIMNYTAVQEENVSNATYQEEVPKVVGLQKMRDHKHNKRGVLKTQNMKKETAILQANYLIGMTVIVVFVYVTLLIMI